MSTVQDEKAERAAVIAVDQILRGKRQGDGESHLRIAVAALGIAQAAERLARAEIIAARELDGVTWEEVGAALGVSRQTAHERFRTGPDGMHSRRFKLTEGPQPKPRESAKSGVRSSKARAARTASSARS